jgi:hypothetical protein
MGIELPAVTATARAIHVEMQALAMHTDTLKKQARNTLDLHVSLVKVAFLETAGELHIAPEVLAVLPDAFSKVARDASTVNKLRTRIKKLKKALNIADGYDLSLINDQRSENLKAVIHSLEIRMQLDLALFWLGKNELRRLHRLLRRELRHAHRCMHES